MPPLALTQLLRLAEKALEKREFETAQRTLGEAASLPIADAAQLNRIGQLYGRMAAFDRAALFFRKALRAQPDDPVFLNNLGLALSKSGRFHDAESVFHDALAKYPDAPLTRFNLGVLYEAQNRLEDARVQFAEEIRLRPSADAHCGLAAVLDRLGDAAEARRHAERALELDPKHAEAARVLSSLQRRAKDASGAFTLAERALKTARGHAGLLYEAGHALHELGRFAEAFERFVEANRQQLPSPETRARFLAETDAIATFFDMIGRSGAVKRHPRAKEGPIFLVGSPRSGTTLLAAMLGMHSKISNAGELESVPEVYREANRLLGSPNDAGKIIASAWHPRNASLAAHLARFYREKLAPEAAGGKPYLLDKMPSNARRLAMIALVSPGSPVIHIIRDGREVAFSAFTQDFRKETWHSHCLSDALTEWRATVRLARAGAASLKLDYHEVFYEKLVTDPEGTLGGVLAFLGLDWEEACLDYHRGEALAHTASYDQVRQKIFTSSLNKAKNYSEQYARMSEEAAPLLKELGYL